MKVIEFKSRTDIIGMLASILCMIHCIATPFIFLAKSCSSSCCEASPGWWSWLDFFFLLISFYAVYQSSQLTTKKWVKYTMWVCWILLLITILNEYVQLLSLYRNSNYLPAIMLVIIHFYNLKFCKCKTDTCCIN